MKTIVVGLAKDQISINEINDNDFIGIEWGENAFDSDDRKAVVIRNTEGFASFTFNSRMPDLRNVWYTNTAQEYVNRALKQRKDIRAYKFETSKELITWLNE